MITHLIAQAQSNPPIDLGDALKLKDGTPIRSVFDSPAAIIQVLLPNLFLFSGLIVLGILVFGGFTMVASGGDSKGLEKGRQAIQSALIGFLLIFGAYWIVQIIQIVTGLQIFNSSL